MTPPCPPTATMIRLKKSALFCRICCTMLLRSSSSCFTSLLHAYNFAFVHASSLSLFTKLRPVARCSNLSRLSDQYHHQHATAQTPPCMVTHLASLSPVAPLSLPPPTVSLAQSFLTACRSHILSTRPSAPRRPTDCQTFCSIVVFHLAVVTFDSVSFCQPEVVAVFLQRLIVCGVLHQNGCNIMELEALCVALVVAHVLDPEKFAPLDRIAHRARDEAQLLQALVFINLLIILLVRLAILRLRKLFPHHCFPLLLRTSSTAHGTLVAPASPSG